MDVPRITVAGVFQVDGSAAPNSAYNYARIGLRLAGTDEILTVGDTYEQGFGPIPLIAGTYEAIYTRSQGEELPINVETVFIPKLDMPISGTYNAVRGCDLVDLNTHLVLRGGRRSPTGRRRRR